jgi:hypothetical protein
MSVSPPLSVFKTRGPLDPVNDSAIYAPRPELDRLLNAANAPTVDSYYAILGSRQTGKSTLLYQLRHRVRPRGIGVVLIDLALVRDQPEEQLYRFVAREVRSELEPNLARRADKQELAALPGNPVEFREFLMDMARQVGAPRILLLMDEVEAVPGKYSDSFFGALRNIFSSRRKEDEVVFEKYLIVFSGARELHRLTSGTNSPLNIAERIYLRDLDLEGVRFLAGNFQRANIAAPDGAAEWIYAQTEGHPYLTQKLCAQIEQARPESITPEVVALAAEEILRSDDHLEKMIISVDEEPAASSALRQIVAGDRVQFSRLNPTLARLELLGAIRDAGQQCVVRNAIYLSALRAHFGIAERREPLGFQPGKVVRPLVLLLALFLFVINIPFLYVYATDILFAPRSANEVFSPPELGARAIIRYDRVLRAGDPNPNSISVEVDEFAVALPITVSLHHADADILDEKPSARRFDPPSHRERFTFTLNQSGIRYNPFSPATEHRFITLNFQMHGKPALTHTADFRVDYVSEALISFGVSVGSIIAFFATLWANVQKARGLLAFVLRLVNQTETKKTE